MKESKNVLFVGAHPDDVEFGCGGTLVKHVQRGDSVFCIVLTNGEKGSHSPKNMECIGSLKFLGVKDVFFGGFSDGSLLDNYETVSFIESIIKELRIDRVYTHDPNDRHQDHRNCSRAVSSAARGIKEIFLFSGPSTTFFNPHYIIELTEKQIDKKIKALSLYQSQLKKPSFNLSSIKPIAKVLGSKYNIQYAEAYNLNHLIVGGEDV